MTQPLIYSRRRRSKRLAGLMIIFVWALAALITSPPLLGCFPRARNTLEIDKKCSYNMDMSYVIFSAVGSFFLPMLVMLYVYGRISWVIAKRHRNLETSDTVTIGDHQNKNKKKKKTDNGNNNDKQQQKSPRENNESSGNLPRMHRPAHKKKYFFTVGFFFFF